MNKNRTDLIRGGEREAGGREGGGRRRSTPRPAEWRRQQAV